MGFFRIRPRDPQRDMQVGGKGEGARSQVRWFQCERGSQRYRREESVVAVILVIPDWFSCSLCCSNCYKNLAQGLVEKTRGINSTLIWKIPWKERLLFFCHNYYNTDTRCTVGENQHHQQLLNCKLHGTKNLVLTQPFGKQTIQH